MRRRLWSSRTARSAPLVVAPVLLAVAPARADVSSWLGVGVGHGWVADEGASRRGATLQLLTGMGSPPSGVVAVGGLLRLDTHFGLGSDLSLPLRVATRGFVNGDYGLALDGGVLFRTFGSRRVGPTGALWVGGPWGLQLGATGFRAAGDETLLVLLGVDLARLTVYRTTGERWWRNPFPAYRPDER